MEWLYRLRMWLIFKLLTKNERCVIMSSIDCLADCTINKYADCMGETYQEFTNELMKLRTVKPRRIWKQIA